MRKILVVDIGGTHVKLMISAGAQRKFDSGPDFTPQQLVERIKENASDWRYDAVSIGFPSPVMKGRIVKEPRHLGRPWIGFNFSKALRKPVHVINDAAMQAVGSYHGRRMLFLGLGTGLGATLIWPGTVLPLELGDLPYDNEIIDGIVGKAGLERLGKAKWKRVVLFTVQQLKIAFLADYVVLGGGNRYQFNSLPLGIEPGDNRNAFVGGCRLWQTDPRTRRSKWTVL
ncbi:MAG: ROK family protein [Chthoniobacterales bacterium]